MAIEHRPPTESTVKNLYANAFRCGHPQCSKPLYKLNDETGERILNSRVAHIHARSEGGPRWLANMGEDVNRSAANLVLLCIDHAAEVDDPLLEHIYDPDTMRAWKQAQLDEYDEIQRSWPLSDEEAEEVLARSEGSKEGATAASGFSRAAAEFEVSSARARAALPAPEVARWVATNARYNVAVGRDSETGELLHGSPPPIETTERRQAVVAALAEAQRLTEEAAGPVQAELITMLLLDPDAAPWCASVTHAVEQVISAAGWWPDTPTLDDDDRFQDAVQQLRDACRLLVARMQGSAGDPPPAPPAAPVPPAPTAAEAALAAHEELLERARRATHGDRNPYDPILAEELRSAANFASRIPDLLATMSNGLHATASLAAAVVMRTTDDGVVAAAIVDSEGQRPAVAAVSLLRELMLSAREAGRTVLADAALDAATRVLAAVAWDDAETWQANEVNVRWLAGMAADVIGQDVVRRQLAEACSRDTAILNAVVLSCGDWAERRDVSGRGGPTSLTRDYRTVPSWFPLDVVAERLVAEFPDLEPTMASSTVGESRELEILASQLLARAAGAR